MRFRNITIIFASLLLCGCNIDLNLLPAATEIKIGLAELSNGLKKIDPIGAQRLFDENAGLRQQLAELLDKANSYASTGGVVVLHGSKVKLRSKSYVGEFVINAWNGDEHILQNFPFALKPLVLPDRQSDFSKSPSTGGFSTILSGVSVASLNPQGYAQWSFEEYLKTALPKSLSGEEQVTLNYTFGGEGRKTIKIEITPTKAALNSLWNFLGEIILEHSDGKSDVILGFGFSGNKETLNQTQKPVLFNLVVMNKRP